MQSTLAYAPTREDLDEVFFDAPLITLVPTPQDQAEAEPARVRPLSRARPSAAPVGGR